jgi:hemolysin activation/secretion protein
LRSIGCPPTLACARVRAPGHTRPGAAGRWRRAAAANVVSGVLTGAMTGLMAGMLALSGAAAAATATDTTTTAATSPGDDTQIVREFVFDGHHRIDTAALQALAEPFRNRPVRALDLEELRQRISRAYVAMGLVNSGAVIPEGAFDNGRLRIRIIEGTVLQLRQRGMPRLVDAYVGSRLVQAGDTLDVPRLQERFRLLLADPLFERINTRLLPGPDLGQSIVDVELTPARAWQLGVFAHNHQAPAVGSEVLGVDGSLRNLIGWGDTATATLSRSRGGGSYDLGWALPLGGSRTVLTARLARAASSVVEEPLASLDVDSVVHTKALTLSHPLIDGAQLRWTVGLGNSVRRNHTAIDGEPFSFLAGETTGTTRVRTWQLFQDLVLRADRHVLALRASLASGHNNLPTSDDPAAVDNVGPVPPRSYRVWQGQAQAALAVGDRGAQVLLRGQVQRASAHLVPLEQLSLGGRATVRGFRENQLVRDNGYALSAEYHQPLSWGDAPWQRVTLIPFVDAGSAHDRGAPSTRLASAGLGLQWRIGNFEAELFAARRLAHRHTDTHGDLQDHGLHVSLRWQPF